MNSNPDVKPVPVPTNGEREFDSMMISVEPNDTSSIIGVHTTLASQLLYAETPSDFFVSSIMSFRTEVAIPFKWEEVPGKPKTCTDITPYELPVSLQPPPGLLQRADASPPLLNRSHSSKRLSTDLSTGVQDSDVSKAAKPKGFWHKLVIHKKEEDRWSPTSTLFGPEPGKRRLLSSFSSLSSSSVPDLSLTYSPRYSDVQSDHNALTEEEDSDLDYSLSSLPNISPRYPHLRGEKPGKSQLKKRASESMRSLVKLCRSGLKWRHSRLQQKRRFTETEVWAPTLATYFHSMEMERESDKVAKQSCFEDFTAVRDCEVDKQESAELPTQVDTLTGL